MKICSLCQRCFDDEAVLCIEEGHPALPESRDRDRNCVTGYHLEHLLQIGQNWETYRAVEDASGRPCLIRIILPNARNGEQFLGEATLAATLFNPNFADVYDAGTLDGGEFFAVTEETEGETVRQVLKRSGPPKLLTTVEIIRQTAEALFALHNSGLVHRAIRPENIVLTTDTDDSLFIRLQCPDFGGAIERSITSNKFLIDTALDSLRYYAPEQFTGEPATPQTDLYSLGIVLFEMLAGVPPFDAPKATALIAKHRNQPPPELRIADFNLRMLLTHTLKESLNKQARLRQSSANAFARQLRHIEQLATHVSTPPPAGTVPIPTRERPVMVAAAAATPVRVLVPQPEITVQHERPVQMEGLAAQVGETVGPAIEVQAPEAEPVEAAPAVVEPQPTILERALERLSDSFVDKPAEREELAVAYEPERIPVKIPESISAKTYVRPEAVDVPVAEIPIPETGAVTAAERARMRIRKRKLRSKIIRTVNAIADDRPAKPLKPVVTQPIIAPEVPQPVIAAEGEEETNHSGIKLPDRNTVETAMREALAARSARPVRKVELKLYDDDFPTDADALQSAAIDQAVQLTLASAGVKPIEEDRVKPIQMAVAKPIDPTPAPAAKTPARIEWEQPEDDIPTEADVLAVLAEDGPYQFSTLDAVPREEVPAAAELYLQPDVKNETVVPVRAEGPTSFVVEERSVAIDQVEEPPVPAAAPESAVAEPAVEVPIEPIAAVSPAGLINDNAPLVDAAPQKEPIEPLRVKAAAGFAPASFKRTKIEFAETADQGRNHSDIIEVKASEDPDRRRPNEQDPDEITLVAPPSRRIRIDVKQPGRWKVTPPANYRETFVPTILGADEELPIPAPNPDHKDPILSVYYGAADPNRRSPYRSMVIGGGFLVSVVLLLFGNVLVREEARTEAAGTTVASKTFPSQTSPVQPAKSNFVPVVREIPTKAPEKRIEDDADKETSRVKSKEEPVTNKEQTKTAASKTELQNRPTKSASVKPVNENPRSVASTVVISSKNGKVSSKVEPEKGSAGRPATPNKKSAGTRPRIVIIP